MKKLILANYKNLLGAVASFVSRLGVLPPNLNLVGSYGFFGNPIYYLITIILFDFLVGGFYQGYLFTYLGFAIYPLLGRLAQRHLKRQVLLLPVASFLFFAVSNLGVFLYWYPHTWQGLITCYLLALPFYKYTLIGDLVFGYGYLAVRHVAYSLSGKKTHPLTFAS